MNVAWPRIRRRTIGRALAYGAALLISAFILAPIYLIVILAFSPEEAIRQFPKDLIPTRFSLETLDFLINSTGTISATFNSVWVALITLVLSLGIGAPAGYALARFVFPGRDAFKVLILTTRAFPIVLLSIPLAVLFIRYGLYDTILAVALVHTALALPFTILVTSSIFVAVSRDLEEAAMTLGCSRASAFWRVVLPLALPGLAAAAIFTFVLSWNEVFAATILTLHNRTLPAHLLAQLNTSPLEFKFAGGFFMVAPTLLFIFVIRRYLLNLWGRVVK